MRDELLALLREVAFGTDPNLTPDHRLRAAETLRAMGAGDDETTLREIAWRESCELDDDESRR